MINEQYERLKFFLVLLISGLDLVFLTIAAIV